MRLLRRTKKLVRRVFTRAESAACRVAGLCCEVRLREVPGKPRRADDGEPEREDLVGGADRQSVQDQREGRRHLVDGQLRVQGSDRPVAVRQPGESGEM